MVLMFLIHILYLCHYELYTLFCSFTIECTILDDNFYLLCNCLPDNYQSTLVKLKSLPQISDEDHQQLDTIMSSNPAQLANEKIVTFLIVKLCYNGSSDSLAKFCSVMDNLVESGEMADCVREVLCGKPYHV